MKYVIDFNQCTRRQGWINQSVYSDRYGRKSNQKIKPKIGIFQYSNADQQASEYSQYYRACS